MMKRVLQLRFILILVIIAIASIPLFSSFGRVYALDTPTITEFTSRGGLWDITSGPDGNLWFTPNDGSNTIGRISPDGIITDFPLTYNSYPVGITSGPDGNVWFTESGVHKIGRITSDGTITEFQIPTVAADPYYITAGHDGNIWFTEYFRNKIGRISMSGLVAEFPITTSESGPYGITSGPDGNIWFVENRVNKIGKITSDGIITEFQIPTNDSEPFAITFGHDENFWFTESKGNKIGRITLEGIIAEFSIPTNDSHPHGITSGFDGNIWFTEFSGNKIGRITPEGTITEFPVPTNNSSPAGITAGPDGNLWFTEYRNDKIGRVNLLNLTPTPTPTPIPSKIPLILIPGIGGSEFKSDQTFTPGIKDCEIFPTFTYNVNDIIWVNKIMAGVSPCDDYFDVLKLKVDGQTPEYPQIVLNGTFFQGYEGLIKFFTDSGYELNNTLFLFPYDWRKDINGTKSDLDDKINQIKSQTGSQKVNVVAHSMGGLVARNYIADSTKAQNIDKLFTLGVPHLGSVKLLKTLQYGDYFGPSFLFGLISLNPSEVKDVVQNLIGGFELISTKKYFDFYSGEDNLHPLPFRDDRDIDANSVTGVLNYDQIKNLLTNLGRNTPLFNPAETFHNLDDSFANTNDVEVTNVVGSGMSTLGQTIERYSINFLGIKSPQKDERFVNGDKTVPLLSASLEDPDKNLSLLGNAKVFYTNQEHGNLVSSGPALNLVKNILSNDSQLPDKVSKQPYHFGGTGLSVHSPVNMHAYDSENRHTGTTGNGDFEANIPGSSYDTLDDAKFIFLPDNGVYDIKFEATDNGSFDFKIRKFENDINTTATLYNDIPLTTFTKAQTTLDTLSTQPPILQVDQDGNGTIDKSVDPTYVLAGDAVYDDVPPEAKIFIDQDKQDLVIIGVDANPTTVVKLENAITKKKNDAFYLIVDAAGNSLKLDIREVDKNKKDRFRIYSMQYNEGIPIVLDTNHFNVSYNGKKDKLNVKEQNYELKGEIKIRIQYDIKKNKSTVIMREPKGEKMKAVVDGLIILELNTNMGQLRTYYTQSSI